MRSITGCLTLWIIISVIMGCSKDEDERPIITPVGSESFQVIEDVVNDLELVLVGSGRQNLVMAFRRELNGERRSFKPTSEFLPVVMEDDTGNRYNIFGKVLQGPEKGAQLESVNSGMGFWFAFASRYPGLELYGLGSGVETKELEPDNDWLVPTDYVAQGTGFDAIQSLQDPLFEEYDIRNSDPDVKSFLKEDDLVIIVQINDETRVYPVSILNWHEIVNDQISGIPLSVTHCPLTGTSKVWRRVDSLSNATFGVSGLLYNSNLIAFDRETESHWSQIEGWCIFGDLKGSRLEILPHIETLWKSWQSFDQTPMVMTDQTGLNRDYSKYPYGDYRTHNNISYPIAVDDDRLARKERVFCVEVDGVAKAYRLEDF